MSESNDSSNQGRVRAAKIRELVSQQLRFARHQIGLTQAQLAAIAGIKQTLVSKMERGQCLTILNLTIVAQALDVPMARLFTDL